MAALVSSSIPSLFSLSPRNRKSKPLHFFFLNPNHNLNNPHRLSFTSRNPTCSPLTILTPRKLRAITEESGEKSDPEAVSEHDPPRDEDDSGNAVRSSSLLDSMATSE
ncbi:uncharacterized protein A4U43_C06F12030 [Asparagus officinalis]|uniref:Uncharacterized protein n=1 Tax=Asparagus officinalis TaxID=4686 RepID=A0A5P1ELY6_ASPOF|nr:uncharacterized protein A4U43_C06F12030 [Asparagus officinalis]